MFVDKFYEPSCYSSSWAVGELFADMTDLQTIFGVSISIKTLESMSQGYTGE